MNDLELRHLRYFLAVAEAENFTRAAQRLRISQPSISQAVAQLERGLGAELFRRSGKRAQLTDAGDAFRRRAEVVLRKLDEARVAVRAVTGLVTGHVDIGVIPALNVAWVHWVLGRMSREHPGVTVSVHQRASSDVETELEAGRIDIGFGLMTRTSPRIRYELLASEPFCLIVPADSEYARRRSVDPVELRTARLVLLPTSFDMRRLADDVLRRFKVRANAVYEIDQIDSVLATVARTGIPALLPPIVLRGREGFGLRAVRLAGKSRPASFGLLWPAAGHSSPATLAVAAALKAIVKSKQLAA